MSGMIDAAIFDLDGLLIDSEPLWQVAETEVFATVGLALTSAMCDETRGLRVNEVVAHWHRRYPWSGASIDALTERIIGRVVAMLGERVTPLPGAIAAIELMRRRCRRVALASSSPTTLIRAALEALGVLHHFDAIASAEVEAHGKPHPAVYLTAAAAIGVEPARCVVLEDSLNGVLAAKAARMRCIAVPGEGDRRDPRFAIADVRLGSLAELDDATWSRLEASWR